VNVDGEPLSLTRLEYSIAPGALRVHLGHLPAGDEELARQAASPPPGDVG
jgi:hypothetical protein